MTRRLFTLTEFETPRRRSLAVPTFSLALALGAFGVGCDSDEKIEPADQAPVETVEPAAPEASAAPATPPVVAAPAFWTEVAMHAAIRAANPGYTGNGEFYIEEGKVLAVRLAQCGISDISPLAGMELVQLDLQGCPVTSIDILAGMPLQALYLDSTIVEDLTPLTGNTTLKELYVDNTKVADLTPLRGSGIAVLNLLGTRVTDLSPLAGTPLTQLWATDCRISDVSPLAQCPLESLTLHRTDVSDLSPLATGHTLQRLHIGGSPVTDVTPLAGLPLQRLVFSPEIVTRGIDAIRKMPTLQKIGAKFEDDVDTTMAPEQFWALYDAGEFSAVKAEEKPEDKKAEAGSEPADAGEEPAASAAAEAPAADQ